MARALDLDPAATVALCDSSRRLPLSLCAAACGTLMTLTGVEEAPDGTSDEDDDEELEDDDEGGTHCNTLTIEESDRAASWYTPFVAN